jgi:hypothetical protein
MFYTLSGILHIPNIFTQNFYTVSKNLHNPPKIYTNLVCRFARFSMSGFGAIKCTWDSYAHIFVVLLSLNFGGRGEIKEFYYA